MEQIKYQENKNEWAPLNTLTFYNFFFIIFNTTLKKISNDIIASLTCELGVKRCVIIAFDESFQAIK